MTNEEALNDMLKKTFQRTIFIRGINELWGTQSIVFSDEWLKRPYEAINALQTEHCDDCISRQRVINEFISMKDAWEYYNPNGRYITYDDAVEVIKKLPSVQPEIIRCHQCKYAEVADSEDSQDGYTCQFHRGSIWFSGSYCSWAERRRDGD